MRFCRLASDTMASTASSSSMVEYDLPPGRTGKELIRHWSSSASHSCRLTDRSEASTMAAANRTTCSARRGAHHAYSLLYDKDHEASSARQHESRHG